MKHIHKEYAQSFSLEPTKLLRIVAKINERLDDHGYPAKRVRFDVFMTGDRREELANVEDVLALDNSSKHKIERLIVLCSVSTDSPVRREHEVQVDFGAGQTRAPGDPSPTTGRVVAIGVRSDDAGWARRTLSEVEEQVERTWQPRHTPTILALALTILLALILFMSQVLSVAPPVDTYDWLQPADVDQVAQILGDAGTLTEEQAREVMTMQLRNAILVKTLERSPAPKPDWRKLLALGIPLLLVVGLAIALLVSYPGHVFLWGDEVERNTSRGNIRRILWSLLVGGFVIGVASKFLFDGLTRL